VSATGLDSPVYAWGVDRSDQLTGTNNEYQFERDGNNVDVYVLDTGVYIEHNDFQGRASHGADFTGEGNYDGYGHGSHVAGKLRNVRLH
jgi:subtilisin family serine protease